MEDNRKKVLLVGENPDRFTGNGNMLGACLEDIDPNKYNVCAYMKSGVPLDMIDDPFNFTSSFNCPIISTDDGKNDPWGKAKLIQLLQKVDFDIVVFVGIDIWRYVECFNDIEKIKKEKNFTIKMVVPYDLPHIREDWIMWFNVPDQIYVYSEFGYDLIKDYVPSTKYYRPKLRFNDSYKVLSSKEKEEIRKLIYPGINEDTFIFGFVGNNMIRKNIYNMIRALAEVIKRNPNVILYMHTNSTNEVFGIDRIKEDLKIPHFNLRHNANSRKLLPHEMNVIWNSFDYHMIPSLQEGLSWTVVESKLCGIPSLISNTTAHKDFIILSDNLASENKIKDCHNALTIAQPNQEEMIPLITNHGPGYLYANSCSCKTIALAMRKAIKHVRRWSKEHIINDCRALGEEWIKGCHNFQTHVLDDEPKERKNKIDENGELI